MATMARMPGDIANHQEIACQLTGGDDLQFFTQTLPGRRVAAETTSLQTALAQTP